MDSYKYIDVRAAYNGYPFFLLRANSTLNIGVYGTSILLGYSYQDTHHFLSFYLNLNDVGEEIKSNESGVIYTAHVVDRGVFCKLVAEKNTSLAAQIMQVGLQDFFSSLITG